MKAARLSPATWAALLGGAVAVGILLFLLIADKPWTVELPADKPLKIHHFVAIYEWWAAAINLVFVALLGATDLVALRKHDGCPRWRRPDGSGRS